MNDAIPSMPDRVGAEDGPPFGFLSALGFKKGGGRRKEREGGIGREGSWGEEEEEEKGEGDGGGGGIGREGRRGK